jgi:hypothetical protein
MEKKKFFSKKAFFNPNFLSLFFGTLVTCPKLQTVFFWLQLTRPDWTRKNFFLNDNFFLKEFLELSKNKKL